MKDTVLHIMILIFFIGVVIHLYGWYRIMFKRDNHNGPFYQFLGGFIVAIVIAISRFID